MVSSRSNREELIQHLTPPPGIVMPPYPASRDRVYRFSLVAITMGYCASGIVAFTPNGLAETIIRTFIAVSTVVASYSFLVWLRNWRFLVRSLAILGLLLSPILPLASLATSVSSSAIMAAKETHCFHFLAGKIIPWYSLALGISLITTTNAFIHGIGWLILAGLWGWLVWARWQLPLFELMVASVAGDQ